MKLSYFIKSKTLIFSVLLTVFGIIQQNIPMLQDSLKDKYGYVFIIVSVVVALLRMVTTQALSEK